MIDYAEEPKTCCLFCRSATSIKWNLASTQNLAIGKGSGYFAVRHLRLVDVNEILSK